MKMDRRNTCTGIGLIALDVIMSGNLDIPSKYQAGGSCGNVLAILSFLGWETYPIARLAKIFATKVLIEDLESWDVRTAFLSIEDTGSTPIIIHRILKDKNGEPKHKFEFRDPRSGEWLPSFKAVVAKKVFEIEEVLPYSDVHYFDRVSRSSIELAKIYREKGALIVFEPTSVNNPVHFKECLRIAHILKFANDRIHDYREVFPEIQVPLEIETAGKSGLKYRFNSNKWKSVQAYEIENVIDAAGAGDWCTAGIISMLGRNGLASFEDANEAVVQESLMYGQALSALNCHFSGARGIMYNFAKDQLDLAISKVRSHSRFVFEGAIPSRTSKIYECVDFENLLSLAY
jgi:fructokinase